MAVRKKYGVITVNAPAGNLNLRNLTDEDKNILADRPVVYIYFSLTAFYVGQTDQFLNRHLQHLNEKSTNYREFHDVIVLFGQYVDGNSQNDIERLLITYLTADNEKLPLSKRRISCNRTAGNKVSDYTTKAEVYAEVLVPFWENELRSNNLVQSTSLEGLKQSILFKYSPFTELTVQQNDIIEEIIVSGQNYIVEGGAGTGKTVVLTNLVARITSNCKTSLKIGVAVKDNWVCSLERIFKAYSIGKNVDIGSAYQLIKKSKDYDIIIVDEAHRLRWGCTKQNHTRSDIFDKNDLQKNELYLLGEKSKRLVLLYDSLQIIRPADISRYDFNRYIDKHSFVKRVLSMQFRVQIRDDEATYTADDYIAGIISFLQLGDVDYDHRVFQNNSQAAYFGVVDSISALFEYVDRKRQYNPTAQCRVLAGYARPWGSNKKSDHKKYTEFDWVEDAKNMWKWNATHKDWITLPGSEDEIGSIHAVQGVDLDYVGVIIANDLTVINGQVVAVKENYCDINGTPSKNDFSLEALTDYIKNIYYVLLTRGISGIRVYFEDASLKMYFMEKAGLL